MDIQQLLYVFLFHLFPWDVFQAHRDMKANSSQYLYKDTNPSFPGRHKKHSL
jgi:hypothetical protein